jgi:RNA polymerase sigma-70 factor, ECF subfamily
MPARVIPFRKPSSLERDRAPEVTMAELVVRARAGDLEAREELFERHVRQVHGLVRRLIPDASDPEDIVQDVFVRALENLGALQQAESFSAWLRAITIHVVRNRLRRYRLLSRLGLRRAARPADEAVTELVSLDAPPDVLTELRATYRAVTRLEPNARTVLLLRRVEGLTLPEIADELGRSLSTTKRWLSAGEAQLRYELERTGGSR